MMMAVHLVRCLAQFAEDCLITREEREGDE